MSVVNGNVSVDGCASWLCGAFCAAACSVICAAGMGISSIVGVFANVTAGAGLAMTIPA